jgi:trans-aconitate methyltransferase
MGAFQSHGVATLRLKRRSVSMTGFGKDRQRLYENSAISELIAHAAFDSAHSVFEFGCGTATFAARLLQRYLPADARYVGLDISSTMVSLAQQRP